VEYRQDLSGMRIFKREDESDLSRFYGWLQGKEVLPSTTQLGKKVLVA
jgi:hypothetical protein